MEEQKYWQVSNKRIRRVSLPEGSAIALPPNTNENLSCLIPVAFLEMLRLIHNANRMKSINTLEEFESLIIEGMKSNGFELEEEIY